MLTEHQNEKLNECLNILQYSKRLRIEGSAGVGKTYMVNELIKKIKPSINNINDKIYCSAPTNKAVAVLMSKVDADNKITFITTHAALKLKRNIDYKTGEISFKPSFDKKNVPLQNVKLFIIDEASMVNTELISYIEKHASKNKTTVIFIGDNKQLNPVNENDSPVFIADYPSVELTEIVRQSSGNPIISLSRNLKLIKSKKENRNNIGGYIYTYDKDKIIETLAKVNGTDELKYLAYTNQEVDNINSLVRTQIYGNPNKIELHETLIFNSPYGDFFTNEEIQVKSLRVVTKKFKYMIEKSYEDDDIYQEINLKCYSINHTYDKFNDRVVDSILIIHEDSEQDYKKTITKLKTAAKTANIPWTEYYSFIEQFADLKYNHAITVHKSQGSTYKQVIINIKNININQNKKEKKRLLYTAITRASDLLILYNV